MAISSVSNGAISERSARIFLEWCSVKVMGEWKRVDFSPSKFFFNCDFFRVIPFSYVVYNRVHTGAIS